MTSVGVLTAEERANLFLQGATELRQSDGRIFYADGSAYRATDEAMVNTTTAGSQYPGKLAALGDGGYLAAWGSNPQDGSSWGVYAQRFDAQGARVGTEFKVNTTTFDSQNILTAISLHDGGAMVIWEQQVAGVHGLYGQRIGADGVAVGVETFLGATDYLVREAFEGLAGGGFVRVSYHQVPLGATYELYAQRYTSAGAATGAEVLVNALETTPGQTFTVDSLSDGGFLVGYSTNDFVGGVPVAASRIARFDASGALVGTTIVAGGDGPQSVTVLDNGNYVLTRGIQTVTAQVYTLAGAAVGAPIAFANTAVATPVVTALRDGGFLMAWENNNNSGLGSLDARRFDAAGAPVGDLTTLVPETPFTRHTTLNSVLGLAGGGFVATFNASEFQTDEVYQILYQRQNYHTLTVAADTISGADLPGAVHVVAAPGTLTAADSLIGTTLTGDTIELSASGVLDLSAPAAFTGFETVLGASGNDTFVVSAARLAGITQIDGRGGSDTVSYAGATSGQTVSLQAAPAAFVSIENLTGSDFNDTLTAAVGGSVLMGLGGHDVLIGGAGNDTLDGGDGDDIMDAGAGNDVLIGGAGNDTASYATATAGVTVSLAIAGQQNTVGAGLDSLSGFENLLGSSGADTLTGDAGNNSLFGGAGNDILTGGAGVDYLYGGDGSDTYYVDRQEDLIFETANGGGDRVITTGNFYLYANIENLWLAEGAGSIFGGGNELNNLLWGNEGDNLLIAGAGDDDLLGEAGDDQLYGQDGDDYLSGGPGHDLMVGGAGNDEFIAFGSTGSGDFGETDWLYGGPGDDLFRIDSPDDLIFENPDEGIDTVAAMLAPGVGIYLFDNIENLTLWGGAGSYIVGNALDNVLTGNHLDNWILGGDGNDTLIGGPGIDVLFGQGGADTFVIQGAAYGPKGDVIADFQPGVDKLKFASGYTFAQIKALMSEYNGDTAIDLGHGDFVVINNVAMSAFTAGDFVF